ncbi:MAG: sulfur carrier protein ThiS [Bacteroides sp.]
MKVSVNNKEMEVEPQTSIQTLTRLLLLPDKGIAIAVNNQMIPRTNWDDYLLTENVQVVIIKAACGG